MALVVNDRVKETSTTTGTGTFDLAGAATGFQTFVAGIGDTNTTYYAIFNQGTTEWEVGLGTVTDAATDTLARTTVLESSNSDAAVDFAAGTKDVFCTLPASRAVFGKQEGTNFTDSLLVGHSTTGTLDSALRNTGVGIDAMDAITSGDNNVCVGYIAGTALTEGSNNVLIGRTAGTALTTSSNNTALGTTALATLTTDAAGRNTAIGQGALYTATGGRNTALGYDAGNLVSTGTYNICIGGDGGDNITEGSGNVIIGSVDAASATGDRQLMITGYDGSTTTTWISGESTGNVEVAVNWNPSLSTTGKAFVMGF